MFRRLHDEMPNVTHIVPNEQWWENLINDLALFNVSRPNTSIVALKNATQSPDTQWLPSQYLKITLCVLYSVIFLTGALGNGLVIFVLGIKKKSKNKFDILLISLAFADFLASVFGPLVMIGDLVGDFHRWHFGAAMCKLFPAISPVTLIASSWLLTVISYDRLRAVSRTSAARQHLSFARIAMELAVIWIIAISVSLPYILGSDLHGNECYTIPAISPNQMVVYTACWVFVGWGIPLILIITLCLIITRSLRHSATRARNNSIVLRRMQRNRKIFRMFIIIVLSFFLLTMPYSLFYAVATYLMYLAPNHTDLNALNQVNYGLFVLMIANSCINPIIYAKMHREVNKFAQKHWKRANCMNRLRNRFLSKRHSDFALTSIGDQSGNGTTKHPDSALYTS